MAAADRSAFRIDPSTIVQTLILAALLWFGNRVVTVSETVQVHEWRLTAVEQIQRDTRRTGERLASTGPRP